MLYKHVYAICFCILLINNHCSQRAGIVYKSPEGYNLNTPFLLNLPVELDEISGVAFYPKDSSVFAIGDEYGWLYKIPLTSSGKPIRKWKFSGDGDFEDLTMIDTVFYVLKSNGEITSFGFDSHNQVIKSQQPFPAKGNEFEILYYDPRLYKLTLICKDCEADKKKSLTVFYFDPRNQHFDDSSSINVTSIANMMGENKIKFKPSAAAIHPVTGELYILSAVNKLLIVADGNGHAKQAYPVDPRLFKQPEGITFTPAGDMIISNEAAERGVANLLFFKYNKKVKT
jgi:uncharacterized protein YjiK